MSRFLKRLDREHIAFLVEYYLNSRVRELGIEYARPQEVGIKRHIEEGIKFSLNPAYDKNNLLIVQDSDRKIGLEEVVVELRPDLQEEEVTILNKSTGASISRPHIIVVWSSESPCYNPKKKLESYLKTKSYGLIFTDCNIYGGPFKQLSAIRGLNFGTPVALISADYPDEFAFHVGYVGRIHPDKVDKSKLKDLLDRFVPRKI